MNYIGNWIFDSIGTFDDEKGFIFLSEEEYLASPMPYIDETDEEAVQDEMNERKKMVGTQVKICDDGKLYLLMPIPEGVSEKELQAATASGRFMLIDGMLTDKAIAWEERDGELWYDSGIEGEVFDEKADSWVKGIDEDGYFTFATIRFVKV